MKDQPVCRVLVVDDQPSVYTMICDFLAVSQVYEFKPTWVSTYNQAVQHLMNEPYDIAIIDYELGETAGLDGLNLIQQVADSGSFIPMIMLTGHSTAEMDIEAMKAGATDYLDKSRLRPDSLERSIRYAVERGRILSAEHQQRMLAEALLDVSSVLNSTLQIDEVLSRILVNLSKVIPHNTANIMIIEDQHTRVMGCLGYETDEVRESIMTSRFNVMDIPTFREILVTRKPLIIADIFEVSGWFKRLHPHRLRAYIGTPLILGEQVIGFINLESFSPNFYTDLHAKHLQLFAGQAVVAIQNAFAYERAKEQAAEAERQRLARDLHDAVSQTLFSASVIAETLPRLQDEAAIHDGLDKLVRLTKGALAEMRTLLVELRPSALIDTDLSILLRQLVNGSQSRSDAEIHLQLEGQEWAIPQAVHVSLYRIAQEALNNVIKHARATHATVHLQYMPEQLTLIISDDGRGFIQDEVKADRMGVRIMAERAKESGVQLELSTHEGQGTLVKAVWTKTTL